MLLSSYKFEVPEKILCPHVVFVCVSAYQIRLGALVGEAHYLQPVKGHIGEFEELLCFRQREKGIVINTEQ